MIWASTPVSTNAANNISPDAGKTVQICQFHENLLADRHERLERNRTQMNADEQITQNIMNTLKKQNNLYSVYNLKSTPAAGISKRSQRRRNQRSSKGGYPLRKLKLPYSGAEIFTAEAEASATGLERIVFMSLIVIPSVSWESAENNLKPR